MTIRLREVTPLRSVGGCVFTEDAQMVGEGKELLEIAHRIVHTAYTGQGVDIPESADQKGAFRKSEIIVMFIPVKKSFVREQLFFEGGDMVFRPVAAMIEIIHGDHAQGAGVQVYRADGLGI